MKKALGEGLADVRASWRAIAVAWATSLFVSLPLGAALFIALRDDLGNELAAERLRVGWDDHWHRAFAAQAEGIERTFDAGIVGIGAVLRALDAQIAGRLLDTPAPIAAAGLVYALVWIFFSGGFVARFVRRHEHGAFWSDAAAWWPRLAILAGVAAIGAWAVLGPVRSGLGGLVDAATRDVIDERVHLAWVLGKIGITWGLMWVLSLVHDYARVAWLAVPSRSLVSALVEGTRTIAREPLSVFGLSAAVSALGAGLLLVYAAFAPGVGQSNPFLILIAFALSQLSVLARIGVRALGWASQAALVRAGR